MALVLSFHSPCLFGIGACRPERVHFALGRLALVAAQGQGRALDLFREPSLEGVYGDANHPFSGQPGHRAQLVRTQAVVKVVSFGSRISYGWG